MSEDAVESGFPQVRLPNYEGSLDVLVFLVEQGSIQVNTIDVSQVADRLLEWAKVVAGHDPKLVAEACLNCARLMEIKALAVSKVNQSHNEDLDESSVQTFLKENDGQDDTWNRFILLALSGELQQMLNNLPVSFGPPARKVEGQEYNTELALEELVEAFRQVLLELPESRGPLFVESVDFSAARQRVLTLLAEGTKPFSELFYGVTSRLEAVTIFVVVLQLLNESILDIRKKPSSNIIELRRINGNHQAMGN
jgi:segregation and condensation protein A